MWSGEKGEAIGAPITFLCAPAAGYTSGAIIPAGGCAAAHIAGMPVAEARRAGDRPLTDTPDSSRPVAPEDAAGPRPVHSKAAAIPPFAQHLGLTILSATPDRIEAEMVVTGSLVNRNGTLHGGALMAMADHLGGTGAFMNIRPDQGTVTIESKTNFLRTVAEGDTVRAVSLPLHRGRTTMIWQTTLTRGDGKPAGMVTQTQMVLGS